MKYSVRRTIKTKLPVQALFAPFQDGRLPFLLESSRNVAGMGRYSFFGSDPFLSVSFKDGVVRIEREARVETSHAPILSVLRGFLDSYQLKGAKASSPFLCGAVGYFGYDLGFYLEKIRRQHEPDEVAPDLLFGFYDTVICYDHVKKEASVFSSGFPEKNAGRKARARQRAEEAGEKLEQASLLNPVTEGRMLRFELVSNFTRPRYLSAVRKAKAYIAAGDIYQVNLSQKFSSACPVDDWGLYRRLVRNFPVSFSAFFRGRDFSILSSSPERFLRCDGRRVLTRPMKGTRPRAEDPGVDKKMRQELQASAKEKAELLMITDLERNDLGRVCEYGSIKVRHLRRIENYHNVFQATAEVEGLLHRSFDRIDLVRACFPGGSVTGCPKRRAMEIIEELEPETRSVYTGSLGYLSFHDTLEFNILIRSFLKKKDSVSFHVGGGIVTDSIPEMEYEETLIKGRALMEALGHVV